MWSEDELRVAALSEQRIARLRLVLILMVWMAYAVVMIPGSLPWLAAVLGYAFGALALSGVYYRPWVSWISSAMDTTLVTALLVDTIVSGRPIAATNSRTIFDIYFLSLLTAGFRADWRIPMWAGGIASAGFALVSAWGFKAMEKLPYDQRAHLAAGSFSPNSQIIRCLWLLVAGGVVSLLVLHTRRLRQWSGMDALTGLAERRPFIERMKEELALTAARGSQLSLAVIDVDGFRTFEEHEGADRAERAVQMLALTLRRLLRPGDFAARFGTQEFVVALVNTEPDEGVRVAEELRRRLGQIPLESSGDVTRLSVCVGVGCWPLDGETFEEVLAKADARLYYAKKEGPDRVAGPLLRNPATVTELKRS
jgi:diguanylate cyclase (GGDEF)-like protein